MKKLFNLTEEEKKHILSRYYLVSESVDPNVAEELEKYRSTWKGCGGNGPYVNLRPFGTLTEIPEFGWANFAGNVDGYNITVNACFDKFKMIETDGNGETGDRGDFSGSYYSEVPTLTIPRYFKGDEDKANKFMKGKLTKAKGLFVSLPDDWEYQGEFVDGMIGGQGQVYSKSMGMGYKGTFYNGNIQGSGVMTFTKTGLILKGEFKQTALGVISVTLEDGKKIDDVVEYNKTKSGSKQDVTIDSSLGIKKGGNIDGITYFESTITFKDKTKSFNGILPKVFIRIISKEDKKRFFETFSNNKGEFTIENVIYGKYSLYAYLGDTLNEGFIFEIDEFDVNEPNQKLSLTLKPTKEIKRSELETVEFNNVNLDDKKYNSDWYYRTFIGRIENFEYNKIISDLLSGRLEQMRGKVSMEEFCINQFADYGEDLVKLHQDELKSNVLKTKEQLIPTKKSLEYCWSKFKDDKKFRRKIGKDNILLMRNPNGRLINYQLTLEESYNQDIYNKKLMGLSTTIKKVVLEHNQKKSQNLSESIIIDNRFKFIVEGFDPSKKSDKKLLENYLKDEKESLIGSGYNRHLVSNSFHEIMTKLKH